MAVILCWPGQRKCPYPQNSRAKEPTASGRVPVCQPWAWTLFSWLASVFVFTTFVTLAMPAKVVIHLIVMFGAQRYARHCASKNEWVGASRLQPRPAALDTLLSSVHVTCSLAFNHCVSDIFSGRPSLLPFLKSHLPSFLLPSCLASFSMHLPLFDTLYT